MAYNFDRPIDRKGTRSIKWDCYPPDVLPLWVADMDFKSPREIADALEARARHGVFGYTGEPEELRQVLAERMASRYDWQIQPEAIVFLGGVISGFNLACHAVSEPGAGLMLFPPIYPPMLEAAANAGMSTQPVELVQVKSGEWQPDWESIEKSISAQTRALLLCSPHNPVGKVFKPEELNKLADLCIQKNLWIVSDEIHCDLVYPGCRHTPIASISQEVGQRTITLMAPSKTFNIAGLGCSFAIVENPELRKRLECTGEGLLAHVNLMGYAAALAAYQHGQPWLDEVLGYLWENFRFLVDTIKEEMPEIGVTPLEGTYLAWLDCRALHLPVSPGKFFLNEAQVALNEGASFGPGGEGFVRLNFACPRSQLAEALERMHSAVQKLKIG